MYIYIYVFVHVCVCVCVCVCLRVILTWPAYQVPFSIARAPLGNFALEALLMAPEPVPSEPPPQQTRPPARHR